LHEYDVIVVGGGSTGCSILYNLAKRGISNSLLIDRAGQLAAGQTSRSTALVRTHYSSEVLTKMALYSYRFFRNFGRELPGYTAGYVETGLLVGADEASSGPLLENSAMHRRLGIDSKILSPEEFAASGIEPMLLGRAFSLFAHEPNAGYAEPSTTASSFASAACELGAKILVNAEATGIERAPSSMSPSSSPVAPGEGGYRIETTSGPLSCQRLVLATGVWSRLLFAKMGIALPLKVSRHPVALFGRPERYQGTRPVVFDFPRSAYYKPEGRDLLFVGSLAHDLDASGEDADPDAYDQGITLDEAADFSEAVVAALPTMGAAGTYRRGYSGVYDNTPDQHPIIDELSRYGYPGVYCVVGLSGHGFKLAPEFGRIVASLIAEGGFHDYDVSLFNMKRFEDGRPLSGKYGVSTIA
jgi:sarcosine oxidase subunit beta